MARITVTIDYDPLKVDSVGLTDSLNEWNRGIAQFFNLESNEETGGYIGYDWEYSTCRCLSCGWIATTPQDAEPVDECPECGSPL